MCLSLRFLMLCMTFSVSSQLGIILDGYISNPECPSNTWSSFGNGKRCRDDSFAGSSEIFEYFPRTNACLIWRSNTRTWQGAKNLCISFNSALAIPTTSNERADWGWRGRNYWANAKRPATNSLTEIYWSEYVSARAVDSVPWDSGQPSGEDCWFRPFQTNGCHFEYCLQIRDNNLWNDEHCDNGNSFYCYTPASCTACTTGACSTWHSRSSCTSNSDSVCQACNGECGIGNSPNTGGGCTCVSCATGKYKSSAGNGICTACTIGACSNGQQRSACTTSADSSCPVCNQQCGIGNFMGGSQVCTCVPCQAGSYKPSGGNMPCTP